jgi:hypothetical protein
MPPRRLALALLAAALAAQTPQRPKLANEGAPLRVPVPCGVDEIHAFGLTCPPDQPCPVYLELAALGSTGARLFLSGNLHTESATLYSLLLATDDGGKTWYEAYDRTRSAVLDQVQFLDLENGWIAGHRLMGFPRDPFLLVTRDGGKTWNERPVYGDTRAGAIEAFVFDTKAHGLMWIDRSQGEGGGYETLESMTGGENWAVRESGGKPPLAKRRPAPAAGWRVRVDPAGKAYRLERQTGERWERVASFLVQPGECSEPEQQLPPEPAPEAKPEDEAPPHNP